MSAWTDHLINPRAVEALYEDVPPLGGFEVLELRLEQRGPSCFVRGLLSRFPDHPRPNWPSDATQLQIRLSLSAVDYARARGNSAGGRVELSITRADDGFGVEVAGKSADFEFEARGVGLQIIGLKPH